MDRAPAVFFRRKINKMAKANTAKKETEKTETTPAKKATGKAKSNVAEFPTKETAANASSSDQSTETAAPEEAAGVDPRLQETQSAPDLQPPAGISENAVRIFNIVKTQITKVSFDEISDRTDFSFNEVNEGLKELEEAGAIDRLPELEYQINADYAAGRAKAGKDAETEENAPEGEGNGESFDILSEVNGEKLKDVVGKQELEEADKKTIKLPRQTKLPQMENDGIPELEDKALSHEDCAHTIRLMKKKMETMRAEMLNIMQKKNIENYSHAGFVIKLEDKGKNVKVVSVQSKNEDE